MAQKAQQLPSKDATLFRHVVQNYETKQYKKGLKAAEQLLKKHPKHGDTQAMKALILCNQGKNDEAFDLCKLALKNSMQSNVCWHVYGMLWRKAENYEEATKAFRFALKLNPESSQIQRDLALLQTHIRDHTGMVQSRRTMLQARPEARQNWTALAVALHLSGDLEAAEDVLQKYEETLKQPPPKTDLEHSEALLYKNQIIAERGETQRALDHLEGIYKNSLDRLAVMELKATYHLHLDQNAEAEKAYRALLDRNSEHPAYYTGLEKSLGLSSENPEDREKLLEVYKTYADKSERVDAPRRLPLDFLEGEAFREHADRYLRRMFLKGVPSTFANLKQLYADPAKKEAICQIAETLLTEEPQASSGAEKSEPNGSADGSHKIEKPDARTNWLLSINYFLAQHYDYLLSRDVTKARKYIDKAIEINPSKTDYTYHMTRARILKHQGAVDKASKAMNEAREMDLKDRYINTKSAKYQLRNQEHETAVSTMGLFTRKEAVGGPLGDLTDMQCVWFLTEDGESYLRQASYGLALKRFTTVYKIFETWNFDQYDFHSFSIRKGMVRAYVDMIRWEDKLREHPFFARAALSAIQIYCLLHDRPELAQDSHLNGNSEQSAADKKKAAKKARKEAEKVEAEKKAQKAKQASPKADDEDTEKKEDADPQGKELVKTEKPLEEAMKFVAPLLELSPKNIDGQVAGFEVYIRRRKYLPALRCLLAIQQLDPEHPKSHELSSRLRHALGNLKEPLPETAHSVVKETFLSKASTSSVADANEEYFSAHKTSAPHVQSIVNVRLALKPTLEIKAKSAEDLQATLPTSTLQEAIDGLHVLETIGADKDAREAYSRKAVERWSEADVFRV